MRKLFLYPFSLIYGFITAFRNQMYDFKIFKSVDFNIPVISVGNITVGGTGKTPHTEYLIRLLKPYFKVATLSRGYKRKTEGFRMVETTSTVEEAGDEPLQIKKKFPGITVSVCENRVTGVKKLLASEDRPDVVLLDDAFQHRKINPGINMVLIDYNKPLKEDMILPAGRLRESPAQLRRANIIIITKCPSEITPIARRIMTKNVHLYPYQEIYFTTMVYGQLYPMFPEAPQHDLFTDTGKMGILLVAGVASPEIIVQHLQKISAEVDTALYPDHHYFTDNDLHVISGKFSKLKSHDKIIVTTEKDVVRLTRLNLTVDIKSALYCLPVQVKFLDKEGKLFDKKIKDYVGENKSNREIHFRKNPY